MGDFLVSVLLTILGMFIIMGVVAAFGSTILWWAALLISAAIVYGGWLIIDGDWFDAGWY